MFLIGQNTVYNLLLFPSYEILAAGAIPKGFMDGKQACTLLVSWAKKKKTYTYTVLTLQFLFYYIFYILSLMIIPPCFLTIRSNN